jgi:hypothetical protein
MDLLRDVLSNLPKSAVDECIRLQDVSLNDLTIFQTPVEGVNTTTKTKGVKKILLNIKEERQHIENPLGTDFTRFFTKEQETLDLQEINGSWLEGKEKSLQARLVLAEKRMLRRLTSRFS